MDVLVREPNVFADTSGVRYYDLLEEAIARAGARKVLYGSDGPYLHPAPELAKILALGLAPEDRDLVLAGNVLRLTGPARKAGRHVTPSISRRNTAWV
nr:amidohydrolase family protein [Arthrobacter nitrophenolicus]